MVYNKSILPLVLKILIYDSYINQIAIRKIASIYEVL